MVLVIRCKTCGYVFYKGPPSANLSRLESIPSVLASYQYRCPRCGRVIEWRS